MGSVTFTAAPPEEAVFEVPEETSDELQEYAQEKNTFE